MLTSLDIFSQTLVELNQFRSDIRNIHGDHVNVTEKLNRLSTALKLNEPVTISIERDENGNTFATTSSPLGSSILFLSNIVVADCKDQELEKSILETKCRQIISLPEKLSQSLLEIQDAEFHFDAELYWERLCDAIVLFIFTKPQQKQQHSTGTSISIAQVSIASKVFISCLARRGLTHILLQRLYLLPYDMFQGPYFQNQFPLVLTGVMEGCSVRKFSIQQNHSTSLTEKWDQFLYNLMLIIEKRPELKPSFVELFNTILCGKTVEVPDTLSRNIFNSLYLKLCPLYTLPRTMVRILFNDLSPALNEGSEPSSIFSCREKSIFKALLDQWENKDVVVSGDLSVNGSLANSVMYVLLYIKKKDPDRSDFPHVWLGPLLNGVTIRLESVRGPQLRENAMAIAAAFATLFVAAAEAVESLLNDPNFASALEKWMKEEPGSVYDAQSASISDDSKKLQSKIERREVALCDTYPLDPDEEYVFFISNSTQRNVVATTGTKNEKESLSILSGSNLPAFGLQKLAKDDVNDNILILTSIRESYNAIVGVGRKPNAQQHEVQEALESGLRGLSSALSEVRKNIHSQLYISVRKELGPLIRTLLSALIATTIYAPDDLKNYLLKCRHNILVDLIVVNPILSLSCLGDMIYRSTYGIFQRNELIIAIGEAAKILSEVPARNGGITLTKNEVSNTGKEKRIYPPIPKYSLSSMQHQNSIVISEGHRSRRWGNAVVERQERRQHQNSYDNLLGNFAPAFISVFLVKLDNDHFKFFQDSDPYTPSEILRSLTLIFQCITNVRHIAAELSEKNFDFFFSVVTQHPHLEVRKTGWASIAELMRTWCGADPLWVRTRDGQTVMNSGLNHRKSIMFTSNWMNALELLQQTCEKLVQKNDPCGNVAVLAVSTLRDLVCAKDDFDTMTTRLEGRGISVK